MPLPLFDAAAVPVRRAQPPAPLPPPPRAAEPAPTPAVVTTPRVRREGGVPSREERLLLADALARRLNAYSGQPVRLAVTDNRSTMVSYHRGGRVLAIRVHHMFLDAPDRVVQAIASYAATGQASAGRVLDEYIKKQQPRIRQARRKGEQLESRGRCYDLKELFEKVNRELFDGNIVARIGWARAPSKRRRKSIRLGVYEPANKEIRIHPALDSPDVPAFFVEFIVFHEMLHQVFPSARPDGRNVHHPRAFRDREKKFPQYDAALKWEKQHLKQLLRR